MMSQLENCFCFVIFTLNYFILIPGFHWYKFLSNIFSISKYFSFFPQLNLFRTVQSLSYYKSPLTATTKAGKELTQHAWLAPSQKLKPVPRPLLYCCILQFTKHICTPPHYSLCNTFALLSATSYAQIASETQYSFCCEFYQLNVK